MKRTCSTALASCLCAAALATAGLTLGSDRAFAQESEQITVVPTYGPVRHERQTRHHVYLTQSVGFSDLDLRTDWGAQTLGARVGYAAAENCRLLDRYYPDSLTLAAKAARKQSCIIDAVYGAQPQINAVVFATRQ